MSRYFGCCFALILIGAPAAAQEPDHLLSPTTQLYVKWDGVTAHRSAYEASVLGSVMRSPTGDTIRALLAKGPQLLGSSLLADPLLDGKPPEELKAVHADLKNAEKVLELILDKGAIIGAEVTEPRPTLGGLGKALGGLLSGEGPSPESFLPDARVLVIVPNAADRSEVLFGSIRLLVRQERSLRAEPLKAELGRQGFELIQQDKGNPIRAGWWMEGPHFVFYAGSASVESAIQGVQANAAKGGITTNPLFKRTLKTAQFESVARGYVDAAAVVGLAKRLAGPFVPGLAQKVDAIGLGNLKAVVFTSGFQGKESRALYEFDLPGERQGLAKVLKPSPVTLDDLPPLPPDVSRFSMLRVDFPAAFDALLTAADIIGSGESFGVEDQAKTPAEATRLRKEYLEREINKTAGIDVRNELLPHLGDKIVIFQSPTEGLSLFGTVVCVSVKDPSQARTAADRLNRALEALASGPMKIRRKELRGVEMREVYGRGFGVLTPTYAVVGDWLVIAAHPQPVQGLILRHKGEIAKWKPDADTAARLAKMPKDAIGLQFCRPESTAQNLCVIGPLFISTLTRFNSFNNNAEFDPIDIGLIPNAHELSRHLFPNLTYTRDDGKTIRIEVNESFSLPLEFIGFEPMMFAITIGNLF